MNDVGQFREVCYEIDLLCLSPNYTFKVCLQRECRINNEVKKRFLKCLGNNSYLSELYLAGNCNFIAKHIARSPSRVARELSNVSTVRPRFAMLTINQVLGPHSVQSETTLW